MSALAWIGWAVLFAVSVFGVVLGNLWWVTKDMDDQGEERDDR